MKSFAFAAIFAVAKALTSAEFEYMNYIARFNKAYSDSEEFHMRAENFAITDNYIKEHNATNASYKTGHNQFSDWSTEEYNNIIGYAQNENNLVRNEVWLDESANADEVNWVKAGAVTSVKNQGNCKSGWAFSATGTIEAAHFIASGELVDFSEQQLIDCVTNWGIIATGCRNGRQDFAYMYYKKGHNVMLEADYPYTSGNSG